MKSISLLTSVVRCLSRFWAPLLHEVAILVDHAFDVRGLLELGLSQMLGKVLLVEVKEALHHAEERGDLLGPLLVEVAFLVRLLQRAERELSAGVGYGIQLARDLDQVAYPFLTF